MRIEPSAMAAEGFHFWSTSAASEHRSRRMRRVVFLAAGIAATGLCSGIAQAQTLFDVEHARGNYRAGLVSEYDADLIRTWGAPSGHYPDSPIIDAHPSQQHVLKKQRVRTKRQDNDQARD